MSSQHSRLTPHPRAAFTLIELLVVIAIIAVLAALLVPVVGRVQNSAKTTASLNNMRQIHIMMVSYLAANNNTYPQAYHPAAAGVPAGTWRRAIWENAFGQFSEGNVTTAMETTAYRKIMWCPLMSSRCVNLTQNSIGNGSYSLNRYFMASEEADRRIGNEKLIGRNEPYLASGSVPAANPSGGTFYYFDSSETYTGSNPPTDHQLNYSYGSSAEAALVMFIDGHAEMLQKDPVNEDARQKAILLNSSVADPNTLE